MKRFLFILTTFCVLTLGATIMVPKNQLAKMPKTVQGVDYHSTLPVDMQKSAPLSDYPDDPGDLAVPDGDFTFDMIESWTGEGSNQAALVIQWNDSKETTALVFGYRWDGMATGADMIRAVVAAHPQLYGLIQYTNVSSPTDPDGGYTINGFGWDRDADGDIALIDTGNGNKVYESEDGLFIHPRGYVPGQGGSSDYDYDNWEARDTDDFWGAGWYLSYWSYWVKENEGSTFSYSSWGASGRVLQNGSWDGWNFSLNFMPSDWKKFKAAPSPIPEGVKTLFKVNGIYYELKNYQNKSVAVVAPIEMEGETLSAYTGAVTVPATFTDGGITYNVTAVENEAFKGSAVTAVTLPMSVTGIGKSAFEGSTLTSLSVAKADETVVSTGTDRFDHVTKVGDAAFRNCSGFKDVFYPATVKDIGTSVFAGTGIENVTIPSFVETIGESAFADCASLTSIELPKTLKAIDAKAFAGCDALTSVKCEATTPLEIFDDTFSAAAYQNATLSVPNGFSNAYKNATGWGNFAKYVEFMLNVEVNDLFVLEGISYRVTAMDEGAKNACVTYMPVDGVPNRTSIKAANAAYDGDIVVPDHVKYQNIDFKITAVNDSAFFEASNITSLSLPDAITRMGNAVCYDCTKMTSIKLPANLKELGDYALAYTKITTATLPEGFEKIGVRAFMSCSALTSITLPSSLKTIDNYGFYGCKLEQISIPNGVETLGTNVFQSNTSLKKVKLPSSLTVIPSYIFSRCSSLESVEIPATVTAINASAFAGCSKLKIDIPANVTTLGTEAFGDCISIETITVPASIKQIPNSLFNKCTGLKSVTMAPDVTVLGNNVFNGCTSLAEIKYHGQEASGAPARAESQGNVVTLPSTLSEIGNYCFDKCTSISGFNLPEGLMKIGSYAFADNKSLTEIELPGTVTSLGSYCFRGTGLTKLVIPASVNNFGTYLAQNCTGIVFYICNPKPVSCSGTTFSPSGYNDTSTLWVPTGSKSAYEAANYWKKNTIKSPSVNALTIGGNIESSMNRGITSLSIPFGFTCDVENLPQQFVEANSVAVASSSTLTLNYKDAAGNATEVPVSCKDGKIVAEGLDLKKGVVYTATVKAVLSDYSSLTSPEFPISQGTVSVPEEIKVWYGDGPDQVQVTVRFNDGKGVENITAGVRFTAPASVESVMETLVRNDRRFYALKDSGKFIGYGFDLNGDNVIGLTGSATLTGTNGIFTAESAETVTPAQDYDHWAQNSADSFWKAFRGEDFSYRFSECDNVLANDLLLLDYTSAAAPEAPGYYTYLEDAETVGAWIPEGLNIAIADEAYVPVLLNVGSGNSLRSLSWRYLDAAGESDTKIITRATLTNPAKGNTQAKLTFGNNVGDAYLSVRANISTGNLDYTEPVKVQVTAPEIPVTSVSFAYGENGYDAHFTEVFQPDFVIEPANATYTQFTYTTSDHSIASVDNTGKVTCARKEGSAAISTQYAFNPEIKADFKVNVAWRKPIQKIDIEGVEGDEIILNPKHLIGLIGKFTPADADIREFNVTLEDAGDRSNPETLIASMYKVNYWDDDNVRMPFYELSGHHIGECKIIIKATDGSDYTREYKVKVVDPDRTPVAENTYLDGTIILNEEWYGHTNGGMNFVTQDKGIIYQAYERENPGMSFGCTSQYGTIWNNKLLISSKQAADGGDPLPGGGRLVVADAKTFKRLGSIDDIKLESESQSGDGRAIAGATPDKIYMGTHQGIYIIDLNTCKVTGKIGDDGTSDNLYAGQIGDMVNAGSHVFAIKQNTGTFVIDVNTDKIVKTIEDPNVQGIAMSADGNVWIASLTEDKKSSRFVCIDPVTLEENSGLSADMPASVGTVSCGWGAWRTTQFFGSNSKNVLWFSPGSSISNGGAGRFYCWEIGSDPSGLKPVFDLANPVLPTHCKRIAQATYGTSRYDDRTDELIVMTTEYSASGHYRYNWIHFVDAATGQIKKTIDLEPYYWFQSMPIFPDKEDARLDSKFTGVEMSIDEESSLPLAEATVDLRAIVSDPDNQDGAIVFSIPEQSTAADGDVALNLSLDNGVLKINPAGYGHGTALVNAISNGRTATLSIPVNVYKDNSGIGKIDSSKFIALIDGRLLIKGYNGHSFALYDTTGVERTRFDVDADEYIAAFNLAPGIYLLRGNGTSFKFMIP